MELLLERIARKEKYTIGHLYIDGEKFCDTLEDTDRGLSQDAGLAVCKRKKIHGVTAIPTGRYRVLTNVVSPRFSKLKQYQFCGGKLPRIINVPAFEGVLIHIGNYPKDTEGCILVGRNTVKGAVMESTATFKKLMERLKEGGDFIYITIK